MPTINMLNAVRATKRSKYIDLRNNYIKEVIKNNNVEATHVPSKQCRADLFTKALQRHRFEELRTMVDVVADITDIEKTLLTT